MSVSSRKKTARRLVNLPGARFLEGLAMIQIDTHAVQMPAAQLNVSSQLGECKQIPRQIRLILAEAAPLADELID
jgi:hypothetical protein